MTGIPLLLGLIGLLITFITSLGPNAMGEPSFLTGFLIIAVFTLPVSAFFLLLAYLDRSTYAYECTEGFILIKRKTRQVEHALRWDEVLNARSIGGRSGPGYSITSIRHERFSIPYRGIWKKCKLAIKQNPPNRAVRTVASTPRVLSEETIRLVAQYLMNSEKDATPEREAEIRQLLEKLQSDFAEARRVGQQLLADLEGDAEAKRQVEQLLTSLAEDAEARQLLEQLQSDLEEASRLLERFQSDFAEEGDETKRLLERFLLDLKEANRLVERFLTDLERSAEAGMVSQQFLADLKEVRKVSQQLLADLREARKAGQWFLTNLREWQRTHPEAAHEVGLEVRKWVNSLNWQMH